MELNQDQEVPVSESSENSGTTSSKKLRLVYAFLALVVVVVLVGLVVLANLNQVRDESGQIRLFYPNLRAQAELYVAENDTYDGFCDTAVMQEAQSNALHFNAEIANCFTNKQSWVAQLKLPKDELIYCVDFTGVATRTKSIIDENDVIYSCIHTTDEYLNKNIEEIKENSESATSSEVIGENQVLSQFSGIETKTLDQIDSSQTSRFAYINNPSGGISFVDWPWGKVRSYENLMAYVDEHNSDINRMYKEITDADPSTFSVFTLKDHVTPFAKDKNHFYIFGTVIPELDPNSVKVFKFGSQTNWGSTHSGERFIAIDNDTAYFLGRYGVNASLQTYAPGELSGADPAKLSIVKDVAPFDIVTTDGTHTYWDAKLIPNLRPENIEYVALYSIETTDGNYYLYGKRSSNFIATSKFGVSIASSSQNFKSPTFIYNSSGVPRELTTEYQTKNGQFIVKTITSDETHRGGVYIYDTATGELLHEANLKSQLAGYRMIATSPDEKYMYAIIGLYEFGSYSKLYKIEIATGAVTEVTGVSTMNTYESLSNSSGLSGDGSKLVFTESSEDSYPACADFNRLYDTIKSLDLTTGTVKTLYKAQPTQHISEISWLPDESGLTYAIEESLSVDDYISTAPLDKEPNVPEILNAYKSSCQNGISKVGKSYYEYKF